MRHRPPVAELPRASVVGSAVGGPSEPSASAKRSSRANSSWPASRLGAAISSQSMCSSRAASDARANAALIDFSLASSGGSPYGGDDGADSVVVETGEPSRESGATRAEGSENGPWSAVLIAATRKAYLRSGGGGSQVRRDL